MRVCYSFSASLFAPKRQRVSGTRKGLGGRSNAHLALPCLVVAVVGRAIGERGGHRPHVADGAQVDDEGGGVLADHRGAAGVRGAGLAAAGDERLAVHPLDADGIAVPLPLVGDDVEAGLVAADRLRLLAKSGGGSLELPARLNLNHGMLSFAE